MTGDLAPLRASNVMAVTTFRRDGTGVPTPVGLLWDDDGRAYFWTRRGTGKAKRITRDPRILVAPAKRSGAPLGESISAVARLVADPDSLKGVGSLGDRIRGAVFKGVYRITAPGDPWIAYEVRADHRD